MPFTKLQFKPGINREVTPYSGSQGWFDCNHVRFRFGQAQKIGGWTKAGTDFSFHGVCRKLFTWLSLENQKLIAVGTTTKLYVKSGDNLHDITPVRVAGATIDANPFDITNASSTIKVNDTGHGAVAGDFVSFSGAATLGGNITAAVLNQEYEITSIEDADHYFIEARAANKIMSITTNGELVPSAVSASGSDSDGGGSAVDAVYRLSRGLSVAVDGGGWDAGTYGRQAWNNPELTTEPTQLLRIWSIDNFGEDLILNTRGGPVFYWDTSKNKPTKIPTSTITTGTNKITITGHAFATNDVVIYDSQGGTKMQIASVDVADGTVFYVIRSDANDIQLTTKSGGSALNISGTGNNQQTFVGLPTDIRDLASTDGYAPIKANGVLVSEEDKHIITWGATVEGNAGTEVQDPLLIRFSDQANPLAWQSLDTNTAGSITISSGNKIVVCVQTKQEILVLTDASAHSMQFLGPPFTFGQKLVSENITIVGATSAVAVDDLVYWMGVEEFYMYNGAVQTIPCSVRDYIFDDFNIARREMVVAGANAAFDEIWWFYPSKVSNVNDKYVIYNTKEGVWSYGNLQRDAWLDRSLFVTPLATKDGHIFEHENGFDDDTSPLTAFIESADLEMGSGDDVSFISRVVPDLSFRDSTNDSATATFTLKAKDYPGNNYQDSGSQTQGAAAQKDPDAVYQYGIDSYTDKIDVRIRGRSFILRLETTESGVEWRLGTPRVNVQPDGKR